MKREELKSMFDALRHDPQHHLGLGDIRLTVAQQDLILDAIDDPLPPAEGAEAILKEGLDDGRYADIVDGINIDVKQPFYQAIIRYAEDVVAAQPQPTAEGAEEIRKEYSEESLNFFRLFIKARKELCAISPTETYSLEEAIRKAFDGFFPRPLSIIDDAETILNSHPYLKVWIETLYDSEMKVCSIEQAIWAIEKAATLHAQRIADKMVSERLREELIAYKTYENIFDNRFTTVEDLIDEYLKTRER